MTRIDRNWRGYVRNCCGSYAWRRTDALHERRSTGQACCRASCSIACVPDNLQHQEVMLTQSERHPKSHMVHAMHAASICVVVVEDAKVSRWQMIKRGKGAEKQGGRKESTSPTAAGGTVTRPNLCLISPHTHTRHGPKISRPTYLLQRMGKGGFTGAEKMREYAGSSTDTG